MIVVAASGCGWIVAVVAIAVVSLIVHAWLISHDRSHLRYWHVGIVSV